MDEDRVAEPISVRGGRVFAWEYLEGFGVVALHDDGVLRPPWDACARRRATEGEVRAHMERQLRWLRGGDFSAGGTGGRG